MTTGYNDRNLIFPHKGCVRAATLKEGIGFNTFGKRGYVYPSINMLPGDSSKGDLASNSEGFCYKGQASLLRYIHPQVKLQVRLIFPILIQ